MQMWLVQAWACSGIPLADFLLPAREIGSAYPGPGSRKALEKGGELLPALDSLEYALEDFVYSDAELSSDRKYIEVYFGTRRRLGQRHYADMAIFKSIVLYLEKRMAVHI